MPTGAAWASPATSGDAEDPQAAEIAVTIVDDWQGRGLGTELLARLSGRARSEGIHRFTALVADDNTAMAGLLRNMSANLVGRSPGTVEYEITLMPQARARSHQPRASARTVSGRPADWPFLDCYLTVCLPARVGCSQAPRIPWEVLIPHRCLGRCRARGSHPFRWCSESGGGNARRGA